MRDREIVERVREATDLLALVGQAVKLRKQGSAHVGLCPFHAERSPSFQVVANRGFYHCFGCGKHGDAFTWLMEREGMTFPEALETLARGAGIDLPQRRERPSAEVDLETRMRSALDAAQSFFEAQLARHAGAQTYLRERGYKGPFLAKAGFGMAPDGWEGLVSHLRNLNFSGELLEQAGLASRSERGTQIDFLRNRLTIPIHDVRGRLVAFGGRIMGEGQPKYLNTRDTPLFHKGETLFGFHRAKGAMKDGALVVEGYFDVLQLHQHGIHQAVAPLGTALTEEHLKALGRFTRRVILCFDGDNAGRRAMEKSLRMALPLGFEVRLLELPQGEDPDTWCLKLGGEAFRDLLRAAPDWTAFMVDRAMEGKDLRRITDRMGAFKDLLDFLPYLPRTTESRDLFSSLAHQLQVPIQELDRAVKNRQAPTPSTDEPGPTAPPLPEMDDLIRSLLLLCASGHWRRVQETPPAWWETLEGAPLLQALLDVEGDVTLLPDGAVAVLRHIEAQASHKDEAGRDAESLLVKLEGRYVDREIQANNRLLQDPSTVVDTALTRRIMARQNDLLARQKKLSQLRRSLR
ncbi:DNA primase [Geothrix sp. PMB-07]|uniref:DNA primase n=1 Tax=Geothrix sp. PMB-07 TaxID=3068640 RepID=UPI002740D81F|nr:DNA primase [Geothrix sp. PMB-07]WLT29944.1 DNA primase [Geothrix sp. PMB-07]